RVIDVVERVGDLAVLDLEIRDRRATARVPVDDVPVAVDVALLVQGDEHMHNRRRVVLVEREALILVVAGRAKSLQLLDDLTAVLLPPAPHAPLELLAPERLAAGP